MALIQIDRASAHQALALCWPENIIPIFNHLIVLNSTRLKDDGSLLNFS
ncbi:MAG: hypothetical protein V7K41_16895 [Nostoc sp.]